MPLPQSVQVAKEEGLALLPPLQSAVVTLRVTDEDSYLVADAMLGKIQQARKRWSARIGKIIDPLWEALKSGRELKNEIDKPLETLETQVKHSMRTFKLEEARRIQAAKDETDRLLAEAAQKERLESAAKTQPMKERLKARRLELEAQAETVAEQQAPVLAQSSSSRTVKKWRVIDAKVFALAFAHGKVPGDVLSVDQVAVNRYFKREGGAEAVAEWPGVEVYDDVIIAGR